MFSALSAVAALIAVTVAFDGLIAGPVLLAMAVVVAVAGRRDTSRDGPRSVSRSSERCAPELLAAERPARADGNRHGVRHLHVDFQHAAGGRRGRDLVLGEWGRCVCCGLASPSVIIYAVTSFTVTAGVLIGGERGFFAGHMAATICWIAMAAALFGYAARLPRAHRSVPIGGGLGLVAAAMAKLFLFDLGTLDGIFRVAVFIVVGLILLGMGAGYARLLEKQDKQAVTTPTG